MSQRYLGGIITANPTTPTLSAATGVWTLEQQFQNVANWPKTPNLISRSLRFRASASAYLNRTPATAGNRRTWTFSAWVKKTQFTGSAIQLFSAYSDINNGVILFSTSAEGWGFQILSGGASAGILSTSASYRDPAAWYHVVISCDTTQATSSERMKLFVNGVQVTAFVSATYPTQNFDTQLNNTVAHAIAARAVTPASYFDCYLTEINFIDGQALTPSYFGFTDANGVWQPATYSGTYGTNGFYLNFSDNSAATAAAIGKDYSGNGNNWTPNNISVTAGVTYDSMLDVPTPYADGGNGRGNYATLNPLDTATAMQASLASGNLELNANTAASGNGNSRATIAVDSGKWYFEATLSGYAGSSNLRAGWDFAIAGVGTGSSGITGAYKDVSSNQTVIIAVDLDNLLAWVGSNGTWDAGDPSAGTGGTSISLSGYLAVPFVRDNSGTAGNGGKWSVNFGQRPFTYTPPTGFVALNTQNLPTPTISHGATVMAATLYTGNATARAIDNSVNGVSFQPDWVWIKGRSGATDHALTDAVRGVTKELKSNTTGAETTAVNGLTAFNSGGFSIGTAADYNTNAATYVAWQWNAGGSTVTNTSGTISAQVRANATAGFSVVTYTGNATSGATVGHGLGVAPKMIIVKRRDAATNWPVWHTSISSGTNDFVQLNLTTAKVTDATFFTSTAPTSSVFSLGTGSGQTNTGSMVAYCFAAVAGYSAFGSYVGTSTSDGTFVYLGFRPRWIMIKNITIGTAGQSDWVIYDTTRGTSNVVPMYLLANLANAEATSGGNEYIDILSNGFKLRGSSNYTNSSSYTYIYAAFAENPFKLSRAR